MISAEFLGHLKNTRSMNHRGSVAGEIEESQVQGTYNI